MNISLPKNPNLEFLKYRAKSTLKRLKSEDSSILDRVKKYHPKFKNYQPKDILAENFSLRDAQLVIAREYGFDNWAELKAHIETVNDSKKDVVRKSGPGLVLLAHARKNKREKVFEIINDNPELIAFTDYHGNTPLMCAVEKKHQELAVELLQVGACPFALTMEPNWPLKYALEKGMVEVVQSAVKVSKSMPELFKKVLVGEASDVKSGLEKNRKLINQFLPDDYCGYTPLSYAIIRGDLEIVKVLIDNGADVNATKDKGNQYRPVVLAMEKGPQFLEPLLDSGARIDEILKPWFKVSAKTVRLFESYDLISSPLISALYQRSKKKVIDAIAKFPESVNDVCPSGFPALVLAVHLFDLDIVESMVKNGANLECQVKSKSHPDLKDSPLVVAAEHGKLDVVKYLLDCGANFKIENSAPIRHAVWQYGYGYKYTRHPDYEGTIKLLHDLGCKVEGLHHAVEAGAANKVKFLIGLEGDVNEMDENGHTPLDYCTGVASAWGRDPQIHPDIAELLEANGARHSFELVKV